MGTGFESSIRKLFEFYENLKLSENLGNYIKNSSSGERCAEIDGIFEVLAVNVDPFLLFKNDLDLMKRICPFTTQAQNQDAEKKKFILLEVKATPNYNDIPEFLMKAKEFSRFIQKREKKLINCTFYYFYVFNSKDPNSFFNFLDNHMKILQDSLQNIQEFLDSDIELFCCHANQDIFAEKVSKIIKMKDMELEMERKEKEMERKEKERERKEKERERKEKEMKTMELEMERKETEELRRQLAILERRERERERMEFLKDFKK